MTYQIPAIGTLPAKYDACRLSAICAANYVKSKKCGRSVNFVLVVNDLA
jgi:hypothetical protein